MLMSWGEPSHAGRRPYESERDAVPRQKNSPVFAGLFLRSFFELLTWKKTKNIFSVRFFSLMWKKDFGDFKWNKKSFFHILSVAFKSTLRPVR